MGLGAIVPGVGAFSVLGGQYRRLNGVTEGVPTGYRMMYTRGLMMYTRGLMMDNQTSRAVLPVEADAGGWHLQVPWPVLRSLRMSGPPGMLVAVEDRYPDRAAAETAAGWINEWSAEEGVV